MELQESSTAPTSTKRRAGRKKFRETRHPVYRGVRERNGGKWVCEVRVPGKRIRRIWVGTFPTADMAARAYDVAAITLQGESASLNFEDSAWTLPRAKSRSPTDIRTAAGVAADMFEREARRESTLFLDEEAVFNMPGLVDSMAEGLLLTPPAMKKGFDWDGVAAAAVEGEGCGTMDLSLWTHD